MPLPSKDAIREGARGAFVALVSLAACASVHAQSTPLLNKVQTIATASTGVPIEHQINLATVGTYQITLTDLGALLTPTAPLSSVKLAVTSGSTLVGTPLAAAGTLTLNATSAGTYVIHVVGKPGSGIGSGPIGIQVVSGTTTIDSFSDNIALPAQPLTGQEAALDDSFSIATSGTYLLALQDLGVPQSLGNSALTLLLVDEATQTPVQVLPDPANNGALQANVTLQASHTYAVFAIGQAPAGVSGGLYSVRVVPPGGGTPVYSTTVTIGGTVLLGNPTLTAGAHTLTAADLSFPAALSQLEVAVVLDGQLAAPVMGASTQTFTAVAGTYQVYGSPVAATTAPGAGSYSVQLQPQGGGTPDLSVARAATSSTSSLKPYSFDTTVATAGSYSASLQNFTFPVSLVSVSMGVVQSGVLLANPLTAAGSSSVTATAGPISFLAFAQGDPVQGGLFDINLTASGSTTLLFDTTQGVVGTSLAFIANKVTVPASGKYILSASDVAFPAGFANFAVALTQGGTTAGTIYGTDQITVSASPGDYFVNLIAQPAGADNAGTYAVSMTAAPPPTVTLTPSATSVAQGGTVTLTWSSQNATSCTASGGWSGTEALSGSVQTSALTTNTTFTLTCAGGGGSTAQSVTVTVNAASTSGSGKSGGGGMDVLTLLILTILCCGGGLCRVRGVS